MSFEAGPHKYPLSDLVKPWRAKDGYPPASSSTTVTMSLDVKYYENWSEVLPLCCRKFKKELRYSCSEVSYKALPFPLEDTTQN